MFGEYGPCSCQIKWIVWNDDDVMPVVVKSITEKSVKSPFH